MLILNLFRIIFFPLFFLLSLIYYVAFIFYKNIALKKIKKIYTTKIICIGNTSLGGSGKTELAKEIASRLKQKGEVVIISRGYKRKSKEKILCLEKNSENFKSLYYGDEPSMLFSELKIPVVVGENKKDLIDYAINKYNPKYIISDDGYQNFSFYKDVNILVINLLEFEKKLNFLLPLGNLRETLKSAVKRADLLVLNHVKLVSYSFVESIKQKLKNWKKEIPIITTYYKIKNFINLYSQKKFTIDEFISSYENIILCCGIAQPQIFLKMLKKEGLSIKYKFFYPDHYLYKIKDFKKWKSLGELPVVVTYKDAVRILNYLNIADNIYFENIYYTTIQLEIEEGEYIWQQMINTL